MNIGVNTRLLVSNTLEGIGRFTHEVLKKMIRAHPKDNFYLFYDRNNYFEYDYGPNAFPVVIGPAARHPILWYWWFEKVLPNALEEYEIDVLFTPEFYCSLRSKVPTLMVVHDIAYEHFPHHLPKLQYLYLKKYIPKYIHRANKIACVSQATLADIEKMYKVSTEKCFIAYNAVTPGFLPLDQKTKENIRHEISQGFPYFVYIGSMHPRKNIDGVLLAFAKYKEDNPESIHKLLLVGRMAWKSDKIKEIYANSIYQKDIIFTGQRADAHLIVAAAEALLYISLFEGFGIPILEAFSAGVPVITSNISSMPEVAGQGAILVDPCNQDEISKALKDISSNSKLKKDLIAQGTKELSRFSWDVTATSIYDAIMNISGGGA